MKTLKQSKVNPHLEQEDLDCDPNFGIFLSSGSLAHLNKYGNWNNIPCDDKIIASIQLPMMEKN